MIMVRHSSHLGTQPFQILGSLCLETAAFYFWHRSSPKTAFDICLAFFIAAVHTGTLTAPTFSQCTQTKSNSTLSSTTLKVKGNRLPNSLWNWDQRINYINGLAYEFPIWQHSSQRLELRTQVSYILQDFKRITKTLNYWKILKGSKVSNFQ